MIKKIKDFKKSKSGFSMIELLFVMVIISILIGIAIFYNKAAEEEAAKRSMEVDIRHAVEIERAHQVMGDYEESSDN